MVRYFQKQFTIRIITVFCIAAIIVFSAISAQALRTSQSEAAQELSRKLIQQEELLLRSGVDSERLFQTYEALNLSDNGTYWYVLNSKGTSVLVPANRSFEPSPLSDWLRVGTSEVYSSIGYVGRRYQMPNGFQLIAVKIVSPFAILRDFWIAPWPAFAVLSWIILLWWLARLYWRQSSTWWALEDTVQALYEKDYHVRYHGPFQQKEFIGGQLNHLSKRLEKNAYLLTEQDEQMILILQHSIIGILLLDENRQIKLANPAAEQMLGKKNQQLINMTDAHVIESYGLLHLIELAYRTGELQTDEVVFYYPSELIINASVIPVDSAVHHTNFIVLLYDLTQIRQLEKVRSDFVANASHELRTPITSIKGFAETLLDPNNRESDTLDKFLTIIVKESGRLDDIIHDILSLTRLEQKSVPLKRDEVDINALLDKINTSLSAKADRLDITIAVSSPPDLKWFGDQQRLTQVLTNLLENAIHYNYPGGHAEINVQAMTPEEGIRIEVIDDGIGIPQADLTRIFERFYRVDKARSRNSGGTGLGLAIVRNLVKSMAGRITVVSELDEGTQFVIELPNYLEFTKNLQ
ncbi:two-component system histidine kinase PnpS [Bavariicoccus seileri]|uniref:two-component system histidine kinase PnpS n=1 Tax=Bavariicoccus seileri TaxID=549685 RepID=UPI0003B4BC79|nr:ATP-binding protein [Bavariicoccus seileri]